MAASIYKEIAIEPEVMARWDWFLKLYDEFGFDQGRLLAEFPSKWRKMVMLRAEEMIAEGINSPKSGIKMIELLRSEEFKAGLYSSGRQPDPEAPTWIEKAKRQRPSFDAIVADTPETTDPRVLAAEFGFWENPSFQEKLQSRVPRNATELIGASEKLLRKAKEIRFIDPYFDPQGNRPFVGLIDFLHQNDCPCKVIEIYTELEWKKLRGISRDLVKEKIETRYKSFKKHLDHELPTGITVRVHFLKPKPDGENLHPRFILTDIGGLQYDFGLDEGPGTTVVSILSKTFRESLWEEYSPDTTTFSLHGEYPIIEMGG